MMFVGSRRALLTQPFDPKPLTMNQVTGTDTLQSTTGFDKLKSGDTISSSTEQAYEGSRSLKVVTPGSVQYEGATTVSIPVKSGISYTGSVWVKAPLNATYRFLLVGNAGSTGLKLFTATGEWQQVTASITLTTDVSLQMQVYTFTTVQATTFYIDKLRLK